MVFMLRWGGLIKVSRNSLGIYQSMTCDVLLQLAKVRCACGTHFGYKLAMCVPAVYFKAC